MFPSWQSAVPKATKELFSPKWNGRANKKDDDDNTDGTIRQARENFNFDESFSVESLRDYLSGFATQMKSIENFGTALFLIELVLCTVTFLLCSLRGNTLLVKYIVSYRSMRTGVSGGRSTHSIDSSNSPLSFRDNAAVMGVFQMAKYLRLSDPAQGAPFVGWNMLYLYFGITAVIVLFIDLMYGMYLWRCIKSEVVWSNYYFLPKFETTEHNNDNQNNNNSVIAMTQLSIDKFRRRKVRNILNSVHMSALYAFTYSRYRVVLGSLMRRKLSYNLNGFLHEKMPAIKDLFESEFRRIKSEQQSNKEKKKMDLMKQMRKDGSSDLPLLESMQSQWQFEGTTALEEFVLNRDCFRPFQSDTLESLFECLHMQIVGIFVVSYLVSAGLLFVYVWLVLFALFSVVSLSLFQFNMAGANGFSFMMVPIVLMLVELATFAFVSSVGFIRAYGFGADGNGAGLGSLIAVGAIVPIHILVISSLFWKK